jgi:hypothetical protein
VVWQFVQQVRRLREEGTDLVFTRADADELAGLIETAASVPAALAESVPNEARESRVRDQLAQALRERPGTRRGSAGPPARPRRQVPLWALGATASLTAILLAGLFTVNLWHRPEPVTRVMRVRVPTELDERDVEPISEREADRLMPVMVRSLLPAKQEKSLMWHMLICPGCYDRFVSLRQHRPLAVSDHQPDTLTKQPVADPAHVW